MPKIPGINHLAAIRALEKAGFSVVRQGKHIIMSDVDSNHRITSSLTAIQEVVNRGWKNEGVVMCAPN